MTNSVTDGVVRASLTAVPLKDAATALEGKGEEKALSPARANFSVVETTYREQVAKLRLQLDKQFEDDKAELGAPVREAALSVSVEDLALDAVSKVQKAVGAPLTDKQADEIREEAAKGINEFLKTLVVAKTEKVNGEIVEAQTLREQANAHTITTAVDKLEAAVKVELGDIDLKRVNQELVRTVVSLVLRTKQSEILTDDVSKVFPNQAAAIKKVTDDTLLRFKPKATIEEAPPSETTGTSV